MMKYMTYMGSMTHGHVARNCYQANNNTLQGGSITPQRSLSPMHVYKRSDRRATRVPHIHGNRVLAGRCKLCLAPKTQHERTDKMLACAHVCGANTYPQPVNVHIGTAILQRATTKWCTHSTGVHGMSTHHEQHIHFKAQPYRHDGPQLLIATL